MLIFRMDFGATGVLLVVPVCTASQYGIIISFVYDIIVMVGLGLDTGSIIILASTGIIAWFYNKWYASVCIGLDKMCFFFVVFGF